MDMTSKQIANSNLCGTVITVHVYMEWYRQEDNDIPAFIYLSAALSQSGFHFNQLVFILQKRKIITHNI